MTSRLADGPSDNAYHVGDCIERLYLAGWLVAMSCSDEEATATAFRDDDRITVTLEGRDSVRNLRLALETVIHRVKL